jgi:hypothetical protein
VLKYTGVINVPRVSARKYETALRAQMLGAVTEAAVAWLQAVTEIVPMWSGASVATFLRLAREASFTLSVQPAGNAPNRASLGESSSEGEIVAQGTHVFFRYATTLDHLIYNEFNNANVRPDPSLFARLKNPGPYGFREAGEAAAMRSLAGFVPTVDVFTVKAFKF